MKIGITGTRQGMTESQKNSFRFILKEFLQHNFLIRYVLDGCCVGADSDAFDIASEFGISTIGFPGHSQKDPDNLEFRDTRLRDEMREAKPHFQRNRDIVDECDILMAFPGSTNLKSGGGTNYTISYAEKTKVNSIIIFPDGTREKRRYDTNNSRKS